MTDQRQQTPQAESEAVRQVKAMSAGARSTLRTEAAKQHDQWRLFLTGGNGGGLLAISAILVTDAGAKWTDALLCSAWLFAFGMLAAAVLPLLQVVGANGLSEMVKAAPLIMAHEPHSQGGAEIVAGVHRIKRRVVIAGQAERILEPLSVLAFVGALLIPLISFSVYGR